MSRSAGPLPLAVALLAVSLTLAARQEPPLRSGLDLAAFDRSVRPQDDLYRFANGKWLDETVIPSDRVAYGAFTELAERAEHDLHRIILELPGRTAEERQVRDFYRSVLDADRVEQLGLAPIRDELARIDA